MKLKTLGPRKDKDILQRDDDDDDDGTVMPRESRAFSLPRRIHDRHTYVFAVFCRRSDETVCLSFSSYGKSKLCRGSSAVPVFQEVGIYVVGNIIFACSLSNRIFILPYIYRACIHVH